MSGSRLVVTREPGDALPRNESAFWYALRKALRGLGHDVIKKLMTKDGHMVSEGVYYVRTRQTKGPGTFMVWDANHQIRDVAEVYRASGTVTLTVEKGELK
jgi:hypothetical protein